MSASERFATMLVITGLSREGFLPPWALKSTSCLWRYSGNCPAILGFAGPMLLPSAAWQAAQTCAAMLCALPASWAKAGAIATTSPTASAHVRIIPSPPAFESRDFIVISAFRMKPFSQAQFLLSAAKAADLPPVGPPEVAFAGRSNVGKSSAINALLARKGLARTSKTPGRTQTINFYALGEAARLVDLPGYGYARVPRAMREEWRALVDAYLRSARTLAGVVLVMDARHAFTPLDEQLMAWLGDLRFLVLLTKADKLTRGAQMSLLAETRRRVGENEVTLFSSVTRHGVEECRDLLEQWLEQAAKIKNPR